MRIAGIRACFQDCDCFRIEKIAARLIIQGRRRDETMFGQMNCRTGGINRQVEELIARKK